MNCPQCGAPLEPVEDLGENQTFQLQAQGKRKMEDVGVCSAGCPGLWTESEIRAYEKHRAKRMGFLQKLKNEL